MISIKVLDSGCADCAKVADIARQVVKTLGAEVAIEKVTDFAEIRKFNILVTPDLVIDERIVCAGLIPSVAEVTTWLANAMEAQQ
jgi:small redox-active disulfide protein 2